MKNIKAVGIYIGIVYSLSILLSVFIGFTGGHSSPYSSFSIFSMLIPAIGILLMQYGFNVPSVSVDWSRFSVKWLPIVLFLMPALIHLIALPFIAYMNNAIP